MASKRNKTSLRLEQLEARQLMAADLGMNFQQDIIPDEQSAFVSQYEQIMNVDVVEENSPVINALNVVDPVIIDAAFAEFGEELREESSSLKFVSAESLQLQIASQQSIVSDLQEELRGVQLNLQDAQDVFDTQSAQRTDLHSEISIKKGERRDLREQRSETPRRQRGPITRSIRELTSEIKGLKLQRQQIKEEILSTSERIQSLSEKSHDIGKSLVEESSMLLIYQSEHADREDVSELSKEIEVEMYPKMLVATNGTHLSVRYQSPLDSTFIEVRNIGTYNGKRHTWSADEGEMLAQHEGGEEDASWSTDLRQNYINYSNARGFEVLMWEDASRTTLLDRVEGSMVTGGEDVVIATEQYDWDLIEDGRIAENPIEPSLHVMQIDGPNVILRIQTPSDQSVVEIEGGGIFSMHRQEHEGGEDSTYAHIAIKAENAAGEYLISLYDRPHGRVLDSVLVQWNPSNTADKLTPVDNNDVWRGQGMLPEEVEAMEMVSDINLSNISVQKNLNSSLYQMSTMYLSSDATQEMFYAKNPEYLDISSHARKQYEEGDKTSSIGQIEDAMRRTFGDLMERVHIGLNAYESAMRDFIIPAAVDVYAGICRGESESVLLARFNATLSQLSGNNVINLYQYTTFKAPSRAEILNTAKEVFLDASGVVAQFEAADQRLIQTLEEAAYTKAPDSEVEESISEDLVMEKALEAVANDLQADTAIGGIDVQPQSVVSVSDAEISLGDSIDIHWEFDAIYGDAVESVSLYVVDLSNGATQKIMSMSDSTLRDGTYSFDTSKVIQADGNFRILGTATLNNGRIVAGIVDVRVGDTSKLVTTEKLSDDPIENAILQRMQLPMNGNYWKYNNEQPSETHKGKDLNAIDINHKSGGDSELMEDFAVLTVADGIIRYVDVDNLGYVIIEHEAISINGELQKWFTGYMHMQSDSINLKVGDNVKGGEPIGLMGDTGLSELQTAHLHFASYIGDSISNVDLKSIELSIWANYHGVENRI